MGTKVQYKSCSGGYNPMRDLNDDVNGNSWPLFCGEKNIPNYTGFIPRASADVYPGYDKNALKQKMLEHEAIFKNQVYELHRLYRIQKDMMEDIHTKEHCRHRGSIEPSASSSIQGSQVAADDVRKFHHRSYPLGDSCYPKSTVSGSENMHSPLSYKKENSTIATRVASQNGFPKELEVSEARPSKVRKKLFDLQLPADEYVDIEDDEQLDNNTSAEPSFTPRKECKAATASSMKLTVSDVKMCGVQEGFSSVSHVKRSTGLADLNEPIVIEEVTECSTVNIFGNSDCNGGAKDVHLSGKPNFLGLSKEAMQKSIHGNKMSSLTSMSTENKINGRDWFSYPYEADKCKEDLRKERPGQGLAAPHRSLNYSNHNNLEQVMASQVSNPFPAGTWPQLMQSCGKPNLTSFHTHPSLGSSPSLNKSLQSSIFSNHTLGDKWHVSSSSRSNPYLGSDLPSHNGFYPGSSSGSKDLPGCFSSIGFNYLNSNRSDNTASVHMRNGMNRAFTSSGCVDIKPRKDLNLNATFSKKVSEEPVKVHYLDSADRNHISFPWLRTKPTINDNVTNSRREVIYIDASPPRASPSSFSGKSKAVIDLNEVYNDDSSSNNHTGSKNETNPFPVVKKILGVPIFEKHDVSENEVPAFVTSTTEGEHIKHERKTILIDINVACDASLLESEEPEVNEVVGENQLDKSPCARNFIDLNTWIGEDEEPPVPSVASISGPKKIVVEIDLEAPAVPEEKDDFLPEREKEQEQDIAPLPPDNDTEQAEDEAIKSAAEAIINISSCQHMNQENAICSPSDTAEEELLLWFANIVSSPPMFGKECSYKVMDDYEAMALQLPETKEEDFMPKPFVPEVLQKVEEAGRTTLPGRPRRGQARRGRQRRDFQRDILPGLVPLSRNELTEDLQTFGGLMKAMGHTWNSGLTRRNGGRNKSGRGRRRTVVETAPAASTQLMQQADNVEASLEDRSLTGWGKTTRRPRRQRCHVGNAPTVTLT